jgi:hypothetical protein
MINKKYILKRYRDANEYVEHIFLIINTLEEFTISSLYFFFNMNRPIFCRHYQGRREEVDNRGSCPGSRALNYN